jgi:hypothetical protein
VQIALQGDSRGNHASCWVKFTFRLPDMYLKTFVITLLLGCGVSIGVGHEPQVRPWMSEPALIGFANPDHHQLLNARWAVADLPFPDNAIPDNAIPLLAQRLDLRPGASRGRSRTMTTGTPVGSYHGTRPQFSKASGHAARTFAAQKQASRRVPPPLITSRQAARRAVGRGRGGWGYW